MRLSSLSDKEIVNLSDGGRFGQLADAELIIEEKFGKIKAILLPDYRIRKSFFGDKNYIQLPWNCVKKIGSDIIILDASDELYYD